jgi:protein arginine kinase
MNESFPVPLWLSMEGPDQDVAVSTRCRIARNLNGYRFPGRAELEELDHIAQNVERALLHSEGVLEGARIARACDLSVAEKMQIASRRYVSKEWLEDNRFREAIIARNGIVSVMINEEDHLRIQAILPGLQVESVQKYARNAELELSKSLSYSYDINFGYLTASLSNTGTGLRLSSLLHLPALAAAGRIGESLKAAHETGCAVRGVFGEGTAGAGDFYQISNMRQSQGDILTLEARIHSALRYIIEAEREEREHIFGTRQGQDDLITALRGAIEILHKEEATEDQMIHLVSLFRLAVAGGYLSGDIWHASEWLSLAGMEWKKEEDRGWRRYQRIRQSAALRQSLWGFLRQDGTIGAWLAK